MLQKDYLEGDTINTIYFGGGTPSLLSDKEISSLLDQVQRHHRVSADAEITLEANPDDLTKVKVRELKNTPINRLSIGIQSFSEEDLTFMNRAHNILQAVESVKLSQDSGFENITIDLIYGTPTLSDRQWKLNLEQATALNVPHISCYNLTVEEKTPLQSFIQKGLVKDVDEDQSVRQFKFLTAFLSKNNYCHYEISNFSKPGFFSQHNSNYWNGKKYLGIGPSAHSFNGSSRQWNINNNSRYIRSLEAGKVSADKEELSVKDAYNEYVLTRLRTMWGCDSKFIIDKFGAAFSDHFKKEITPHLQAGFVTDRKNQLILTSKGKLVADKIAADLFMT